MADTSQIREITAQLEQGVKDLFESDTYADYLKTMSRFHQYSTRNTLLIYMQKPDASRVAGFRMWQDKFGRHVKKGEKGIKILAPTPFTIREEKERLDPETRLPVLDENGMPVVEQTERRLARFKAVSVFDISQTDGKPLPSLVQDLTGNVEQYAAFMDALRAVSPLPIVFEPMPSDTDGTCAFGDKISIREGMSEIQTVCAVIHEMTHAKLHDVTVTLENDENAKPKTRRTEELEAEAVSFSVCSYFEIETGANSFGYLAEWSKGRELKELNASLDTIRKTTAELIDAIDGKFHEIVKDRDIAFAVGESQAALAEPTETLEQATDTPTVILTPGMIYARFSNHVSDIVGRDEAYTNAFLNSDEQNARTECDKAVNRAVMGLYAESEENFELFRQYGDNPDFKARLEDYVFMRNYLEPKTAQRDATPEKDFAQETPASPPEQNPILAEYARAKNDLLIGANVLMTPVFNESNFNREGKKVRVKVEEPAGKYQLFSREEHDDKVLYFMTASGRIDHTSEYFFGEWDDQQHKLVNHRPTEAELDEIIPQIAERFESDMADPTRWAKYQHAAVLNRLDECEAHNVPVRKFREEESERRRAEAERERIEEYNKRHEKYDAKVDEIAKTIENGQTINVAYLEFEYDGKNPVLDLFKLYGINLPLRTQGWINTGLAEISEDGYRYYKSKHKGDSTAFSGYFAKLREAIRAVPIEQKRHKEQGVKPDPIAEADKFIEDIGGIGNLFGAPTPPPKERINTMEHNNYKKFAELFPQAASGECRYLRLEAGEGMEPLSLEWIADDQISMMHTYTMNGDLMYDPMITLKIDNDAKTLTTLEFENSMPPLYQRVDKDGSGLSVDGNGNEQRLTNLQVSLDGFTSQWLDNIAQQGYMPVRANMEIDGEETQITFDTDGKPILPEPEQDNATPTTHSANKVGKDTTLDLSLPDPLMTAAERDAYGYTQDDMFPLSRERAVELFDAEQTIYLLYSDNTEIMAFDRDEIITFEGLCGITHADWAMSPILAAQKAVAVSIEASREADLLYGDTGRFGIYQVRSGDELRNYRYEPLDHLQSRGLDVDRKNYDLVYVAPLDIRDTNTNLNKIYNTFNMEHPEDYTGRSVSISDVIVLQWRGEVTSHYVDGFGFTELPAFLGEETQKSQAVAIPKENYSQLGNISQPTAEELEADVKVGKSISLIDLSKAQNAERGKAPLSKGRPTLMARLEENKLKAARQGQSDAHKNNEREV